VTSQEEQMLNSLVERVNSTQLPERDPDAAELLKKGFSRNPDAVYILSQSVLVQNIALEQARAQLSEAQAQLQQQQSQPPRANTFLGKLLHPNSAPTPPPPAQGYQQVYSPPQPEYQQPYYGNQPYGGPQYGGPQYGAPQQPSFLRSAAQTAAGVAAGALAFEGVEALLHGGFGHPGYGMGGGFGMPGVGMGMGPEVIYDAPREEIINNYYDSPGGGEHHHSESYSDSSSSWGDDSGSTPSDFGDSGGGFDDGGGNSGNDDGGF